MTGGVFHEHTHRVWASGVGLLVVFLARWTAGSGSRKTLAGVGLVEVVAGLLGRTRATIRQWERRSFLLDDKLPASSPVNPSLVL